MASTYKSRLGVARPAPSANSYQVADIFLEKILLKLGGPKTLLTDRGSHYMSDNSQIYENLSMSQLQFTLRRPTGERNPVTTTS